MHPAARTLFKEVFDTDFKGELSRRAPWLKILDELITYVSENETFCFDLQFLNEKDRKSFIDELNHALAAKTGELEDTIYVRADDSGSIATISKAVAESARDKFSNGEDRASCEGVLDGYYNAYFEAELHRLPKEAFNLDIDGGDERWKRWGHSQLKFSPIKRGKTDDLALFFTQSGYDIWPIMEYETLAHNLEMTVARAAQFLQGSQFIDEDRELYLRMIFGENGDRMPILRVPSGDGKNGQYHLALDMYKAKQMTDAGLCIDLSSIVENHMTNIHGKGAGYFVGQQLEAAAKAFVNRSGLTALMNNPYRQGIDYNDKTLFTFSGNNASFHGYDTKTGQPVDMNTGQPVDEASAEFKIGISPLCLTENEIGSLVSDLNAEFSRQLGTGMAPISLSEYGSPEISYDVIDTLLREHKTVDLASVFNKYAAIQQNRIDRSQDVIRSLTESSGYRGWNMPIQFPECFYKKEKFRSEEINLTLEGYTPPVEKGSPKVESIFLPEAARIEKILEVAHLKDEVTVKTNAYTYHDGTKHRFELEMKINSFEQAEDLAERLSIVKDELAPVITDIIAKARSESVLGHTIFGFPADDSPEQLHARKVCYGASVATIERHKQGIPEGAPKDIKLDPAAYNRAMVDMGSYIGYLAKAKNSDDAEVRRIATEALAEFETLSPVFATLEKRSIESAVPAARPEKLPEFSV